MKRLAWAAALWLSMSGCPSKGGEGASPAQGKAQRLEPLLPAASGGDGGAKVAGAGQGLPGGELAVVPLPPAGPRPPEGATRVLVDGERATVGGRRFELGAAKGPVLLEATEDTYLAQAAGLLAELDDAGLEVWLKHPDAPFAYRLVLKDEPAFQAWLDQPVPGKVRVIQREDGFELTTNVGKLPGADPNGPTVPLKGGRLDLTLLQRGLERVRHRFADAPDLCFLPAFGIELRQVARAMAADFLDAEQPIFPLTCLVYPRPGSPSDAGK